jgi:hypothetical protein
LYASLVLMLMLSAFPRLDAAGSYVSFRAGRRVWLLGQVLTVLVITLGYCLLLTCSMLLGAERVHFHNAWSDTATLLSFSPDGFDPASAVTRKMLKLMLPYPALMQIFVLLFLFMVTLFLGAAGVYGAQKPSDRHRAGAAYLPGGFILTPVYAVAPPAAGVYLLCQSACGVAFAAAAACYLHMHNFGYDLLPRLTTSMLLLRRGQRCACGIITMYFQEASPMRVYSIDRQGMFMKINWFDSMPIDT